jgi:hypothetical protein
MTDKEAMKLALDALETEVSIDWTNNDEFNASAEKMHEAIAALKERLAQPEQEPVVWADYESKGIHHKPVAWMDADGNVSDNNDHKCFPIPLYTHLPQRKPLTNGEIYTAYITATNQTLRATDKRLAFAFARAIEATHDIKENT